MRQQFIRGHLKTILIPRRSVISQLKTLALTFILFLNMKQKWKILKGQQKRSDTNFVFYIALLQTGLQGQISKVGMWNRLPFSQGDNSLDMHSLECPGWFSFLSLNAADQKGAHLARNSTSMSQEPWGSSSSSQKLKG